MSQVCGLECGTCYIILLLVFCLTGSVPSCQDECRFLMFNQDKQFIHRRLINHLNRAVHVPNEPSCRTHCYNEPNCDSYNFRTVPSFSGNFICELNNSTHENHENELVKDPVYKYHGTESACVKDPCKNGGTCQTGFTERGYRCLCTFVFVGHDCEQERFPRYETIGCFRDHDNRAIPTLEGKDTILDGHYRARQNAVEKCYQAAKKRNFSVFAVQHGGWCASSATAYQTFDTYGRFAACGSDGEGGGWANQVYYITGYKAIGCYSVSSLPSISFLEGTDSILDGPYTSRTNPIAKCAVAAMRKNFSFFAVQDGGRCAASATASQTFNVCGKSDACLSDGESGSLANQMYSLEI